MIFAIAARALAKELRAIPTLQAAE